jgi:lipid A 3-O-deacylase
MNGKKFWLCGFLGAAFAASGAVAMAQQARVPASPIDAPAQAALATLPWEFGAFIQGGVGVGERSDFTFTSAGVRLGKVITKPYLPGFLRGQFEYAGELMPYWEAFTPAPHIGETKYEFEGQTGYVLEPYGGGTYTGFSITPIILRWNFAPSRHFAPWFQGAGGLVYTPHKFPPDILVPHGESGGTSVFNFTPQGGVGFHYFINSQRSIDFAANAIHISSASLGDRNPGVNASVQFQIGYTWWH